MPIVKKIIQHKILLDTHVWVWIMNGDHCISTSFKNVLERLSFEQENIILSPISFWEIGMLVEKERVYLDMDVLDWVEKSLEFPGIRISPLTPSIAIQSSRLPGNAHLDPADRILVATAHSENAVLITCDEKLLEYGKGKFVNVHDPS